MVLPEFTEIVGISETFVVGLEVFPESKLRDGPMPTTLGLGFILTPGCGGVLTARTL